MIYDTLYSWQKKIVDRFKERESFGLFLDMGLGKTPVSLAFAEQNLCTKVIVVTINSKATEDASVEGSWLAWASKSDIRYVFHQKNPPKKMTETFDGNDLLLINYEGLFKRGDRLRSVELKDRIMEFILSCKGQNVAIIIDESHKMKNLQSIQTQAIMQIKRCLKMRSANVYTYLLTGTPFTQGFVDLYAQLKMLGCTMTKGMFIEEFCIRGNLPGLLGWQQPIVGYKNIDKLFELVHKFALTIKSDDVVELPDKIFNWHPIEQTKHFEMFISERANAEDILAEASALNVKVELPKQTGKVNNPFFRNIAYPDLKWLAETTGTFYLRTRQMSIGFNGNAEDYEWYDDSRLKALERFLEENEDNYLLFYNFTPELLEIYDICEKLGYNIDIYCGEIKSLKHYEAYSKLSEAEKLTKKKNIILANFASGSAGMNWQAYNHGIIFSMPVFKDYEQGVKRIHRLGQTKTVIWHVFYQKNWLDYGMKRALDERIDYDAKMFEADLKRTSELIEKSQ